MLCFFETAFADEDMYADYKDLFNKHYEIEYRSRDKEHDVVRRSELVQDTEDHRNGTARDDERDIVDRADHVTQYLSEQQVNTDSEITSLQASDVEEVKEEPSASFRKDDSYFSFLTGQQEVMDVDSALSMPAKNAIAESEMHNYGK